MGNYGNVDELGFVTPEHTLDAAATHCFTRIPSKYYQHINLSFALREPQDWPHHQQAAARPKSHLKLLDLRRMVPNAIQDLKDGGFGSENASEEGSRTVYVPRRETNECCLPSSKL